MHRQRLSMQTAALAVALCFFLLVQGVFSQDPCTILTKGAVVLAKDVLSCFKQFPIDKNARIKQIDSLKGYLSVYPFLNLKRTDGLDVFKILDQIQNDRSIKTELDFHSRLSELFFRMRDAHAAYSAACFNNVEFVQPFVIGAQYDVTKPSRQPKIMVKGAMTDFMNPFFGDKMKNTWRKEAMLNPSQYVDWEIVEIDGKKALDAVRFFADNYVGLGRDAEMRFNRALLSSTFRQGSMAPKHGLFYRPEGDFHGFFPGRLELSRTYTLINPKSPRSPPVTVTAPWLGLWNRDAVTSSKQYYNDYCRPGGRQVEQKLSIKERYAEVHADGPEMRPVTVPNPSTVLSDDNMAFFILADKVTGVFKLTDFPSPTDNWISKVANGFNIFVDRGIKRVIIDLTDNGGGSICGGRALVQFLFPKANSNRLDIRLSATNEFLINIARRADVDGLLNDVGNVFSLSGVEPFDPTIRSANDPYIITEEPNINMIQRGGVSEPYTSPFTLICNDLFAAHKPFKHPWRVQDVVGLSEGFCGSTCSVSARSLQQLGVRFYVFGGFRGARPFQATSFEGGMVLSNSAILENVKQLVSLNTQNGYNVTLKQGAYLPSDFVYPVEFGSMLFYEGYSTHGDDVSTPDEYIFLPSFGNVVVKDPENLLSIHEKLAKVMVTGARNIGGERQRPAVASGRKPLDWMAYFVEKEEE